MTTTESTTAPRIVVGVDGSPSSMQAMRWAGFIAKASGGTIDAVIAWETPAAWATGWAAVPAEWNPAEDAEKTLIATIEEVYGEHPAVPVRAVVSEGGAAKVLLDVSRDARMLVVGSRGHGGFAGLLLGSVSTACVEHATSAVLVIHGDTPVPS